MRPASRPTLRIRPLCRRARVLGDTGIQPCCRFTLTDLFSAWSNCRGSAHKCFTIDYCGRLLRLLPITANSFLLFLKINVIIFSKDTLTSKQWRILWVHTLRHLSMEGSLEPFLKMCRPEKTFSFYIFFTISLVQLIICSIIMVDYCAYCLLHCMLFCFSWKLMLLFS